jgi:1,4-dihydroxy-2-naphthoate octaprenyltransferase
MVEYVIAKISVSLYAGAIIFKVVLGVSSQWVSAVCILVATALYTYPPPRVLSPTPL